MADVTLPQLGETVTEGTITRWFKNVGDVVKADEPLFEVSTDKVDTEVPSPIAGTLTEIRVPAGDTVPVGTVIAVVGAASGAAAPAPAPATDPFGWLRSLMLWCGLIFVGGAAVWLLRHPLPHRPHRR